MSERFRQRIDPTALPVLQLGQHIHDFNERMKHKGPEDYPLSDIGTTPIGDALRTGSLPVVDVHAQNLNPPKTPTADTPMNLGPDESARLDALMDWWMHESERDASECLAKLIEYGSADFDIMAHGMLATSGGKWDGAPEEERLRIGREMAVMFYLQGKVARAFGAFQKGRLPSDDTLDDIVRYGVMMRRIRQTGAWA